MDYSPPGSSIHGDFPGKNNGVGCHALLQGNLPNPEMEPASPALQAEDSLPTEQLRSPTKVNIHLLFLAKSFHFSHVQLFATLWTVAHQAPLSTEFPRQEYWSGLPFPPPFQIQGSNQVSCISKSREVLVMSNSL